MRHARARSAVLLAIACGLLTAVAVLPGQADPTTRRAAARAITAEEGGEGEEGENETEHILARAAQRMARLVAPGVTVDPAAFDAGMAAAAELPTVGGAWQELTNKPVQNDAKAYRDPVWSNSGAGWFLVAGRISTMTTNGNAIYAGAADGGVWRTLDQGRNWHPWSAGLPRLSSGSLAVNPADGSIWIGLGESKTAADNIAAHGVFRRLPGGDSWHLVGNGDFPATMTYRIYFDESGQVYAATNKGLWRRAASDLTSRWELVLRPDPNPEGNPYRTSHITDVVTQAGTGGKVVLAVLGWRGGTLETDEEYNGFYLSKDFGAPGSFVPVNPVGEIESGDIGRTTFSRAPGGKRIYAVIESPRRLVAPDVLEGSSNLQGVYVSASGNPVGPWKRIASARKLARSGSALAAFGLYPGIQAWYDQYILVDPLDERHVYLGLEEVFETTDGGETWTTIGPYWNFTLPCYRGEIDDCVPTTHPDQHAMVITGGQFYAGGDGGVWRRSVTRHTRGGWTNLNATLRTIQYYYGGVGRIDTGGHALWGGTQDNGTILTRPNLEHSVIPQGGDGGDIIVDPNDANRAVVEYVFLDMAKTTDGGHSFEEISPSCFSFTYIPDPCDPSPRFIAPFRADVNNINHWVAGGRYVWETKEGWNTECSDDACDWKIVHDTGASTTALAVNGETIYAAWCGPCNPGGAVQFKSGIDTNHGGKWHRLTPPLKTRYVTNLQVDPDDPSHVYAVYGGFSRKWIRASGTGHVFESHDGGQTWTNISGNLPDIPANDLVIWRGKLVVANEVGVFISEDGGDWAILGTNLPNAAVFDLTVAPSESYVVAVTHGRGMWGLTDDS